MTWIGLSESDLKRRSGLIHKFTKFEKIKWYVPINHKSEINNTSSQSLNIDLLISEMRLEKVLSTLGQTN